jgi:hypothetical protein
LGTNDFTVEAWIYATATGQVAICGQTNAAYATANTSMTFYRLTDGRIACFVAYNSGSSFELITTLTAPLSTWTHVAAVRDGATLRVYVSGVQSATATISTGVVNDSASLFAIGRPGDFAGQYFPGYISNFRLVNGTCLYPSGTTFTPPTTQLTAVTNTALLTLQTNVPQNNNQFFDTSTNNFTVTRNGNTTQGSFNPFVSTYPYAVATNGGSAYFDGTGDGLTVPANAAFSLGTNSFTIECWSYGLSNATSGTLIGQNDGSNVLPSFQIRRNASGTITAGIYVATTLVSIVTTTATSLSTWYHVALVRNGTILRLYLNGVQESSVDYSGNIDVSTGSVGVGRWGDSGSYFTGYVSNARIVNGTCLYPSGTTFTPPTAPLTAVTNTALLLGMSNGAIYDNTMLNNLETVGTAQISTSVFKYGTGSVRTGSGNYLSTPMKSQFQFAAGDFTVETWAYVVNNVASAILLDCAAAGTNFGWFLEYSSARGMFFYMGTGSGGSGVTYATTPALTTWTHLAVSRQSGTLRLFINGVLVASGSLPNSSVATLPLLAGAANSYTTTYYFDGYLDDIRITKNIARYTTTFTPPTAAFPNLGPTYPSGTATQRAIFGFGADGGGSPYSITNIVSNTGVVSGDTTGVGTARNNLAAAGYGGDKAIFGFGAVSGAGIAKTNLVSNTGVVATDTTGVGWVRYSVAASGYGSTGQAIFGFGFALDSFPTAITSLVSNTGVVAADTVGVGTARNSLAAAKYGTDKAIFGFGIISGVSTALTNLVSNTGVVSTDTAGVGTARYAPSAAGYGTDKAIFGYGYTGAAYVSTTNLVSNTGVVATDTTGVGTAGYFRSAAGYGGDKAIFGYGYNSTAITSTTNLVSNTGVVATDTTGVGTARQALAAAGFSYS